MRVANGRMIHDIPVIRAQKYLKEWDKKGRTLSVEFLEYLFEREREFVDQNRSKILEDIIENIEM